MTLSLPIDADANELLSRSPLALLIGMLLDQQVTLEKAFTSPRDLVRRLGHEPTAQELAGYDPEALVAIFSERPALHRYPRAMAARVQELCALIVDRYHGDAASHFGDEGSHCSVADIVDADSLAQVRAYKQSLKSAAKATH